MFMRSVVVLIGCVLSLCMGLPLASNSTTETQYLAMVPQPPYTVLKWMQLTYPHGVSSTKDVQVEFMNNTVPEVGAWFNLDMKLGAMLSAKIIDDKLYVMVDKNTPSGGEGGCCADTIRVFSRADGSYTDVDMGSLVTKAMPGLSATASHTFDVKKINGRVIGFAMVLYSEPAISGLAAISADAIVAFDLEAGTVHPTADGEQSFNIYKNAGETKDGHDAAAAIYKIQFFNSSSMSEEWHGNGVEHFVTKDGTSLLAITHRMASEAVIFKSPYDYTKAEGGGEILQRFGTPTQYTAKTQQQHYFGMAKGGKMGYITGGVHNVWYRQSSEAFPGKETMSLFVNTASATSKAYAVEFVLNLKPQQPGVTYDDTVFDTEYVAAELTFSAPAQGGARAIGNGVLVAMSGVQGPGMQVADTKGDYQTFQYPTGSSGPPGSVPNLYDPFCFVMKQ